MATTSVVAVVVALLCLASTVCGLERFDLYPFGELQGDTSLPPGDDLSSPAVHLETPIRFYDDYLYELYVNLNGMISFDTELPIYQTNAIIPFGQRIIAPFLADVDTQLSGHVFYRETGDPSLRDKAADQIARAFPNQRGFYPSTLFIATWEDVGHYSRQYDQVNTFQVVIASSSEDSFVLFLYPEEGIQWIQGDGKEAPDTDDVPGQVGFDSGDGYLSYTLPGSGTPHVTRLVDQGNSDSAGFWLFRVGNLNHENIETPVETENGHEETHPGYDTEYDRDRQPDTGRGYDDRYNRDNGGYDDGYNREREEVEDVNGEDRNHEETNGGYDNGYEHGGYDEHDQDHGTDTGIETCATHGQLTCHAQARCTDYVAGFCCQCTPPFIGNGQECIRPDEAQRISGKVSGRVNGQSIDDVDLHAYVVTTDGRTYTAVSRMPQAIGFSLQAVYTIGSVLGFLFALPQQPGAKNGFMLTGGRFNRTAVIQFTSSRDTVTVRQTLTGQDEQGHMQMMTTIDGTVPRIGAEARVEVDDYTDEYQRVSLGKITSTSTQTLRIDGAPQRFTVDQTITYKECAERPLTDVGSIRIAVTRNFVAYSGTEQIVRFSQTNKVAGAGADLCREAQCDLNADCSVRDGRAQCSCKAGFDGNGFTCRDVDECRQYPGPCDANAQCYNSQGSFQCRCNSGFAGDGVTCRREEAEGCDVLRNCDLNARCNYDVTERKYVCQCNPGYTGDGYRCSMREQDCNNVAGMCDANAQCAYDAASQRYSCRCNRGYEGTGRSCNRIDCRRDPGVCDSNARCERQGAEYSCVCKSGFTGDGYERCTGALSSTSYLVYAQGMYLMHVPLNPTDSNAGGQVLYIPGQTAVGIDVDCMTHYVYWTDVSGKTISRARLDGTDSEVVVQRLGSPEGVAVDWISKNIYWADSGIDKIEVSRLDGTNMKTLVTDGLVNPRGIAVDPVRGVMFWTDWNREAPKIEKANMDGTDRRALVTEGLGLPNGLALDYELMQVCWADAGTHKVECVNYEGRSQRTITASVNYPFGLAYFNSVLYWTDWERKTLPNHSKNIGEFANEDLTLPLGANGHMYGIAAVRSSCPSGSNPCAYNNGGCRYLCLPSSKGGRTCACPDDISPDECNRIALL